MYPLLERGSKRDSIDALVELRLADAVVERAQAAQHEQQVDKAAVGQQYVEDRMNFGVVLLVERLLANVQVQSIQGARYQLQAICF